MYNIQETQKGDFIVRNPGGREMFKGTKEAAQAWIDRKQAEFQEQAQQAVNQEAFDNVLPDLNEAQIRWQKWRNWFYGNLQREGRRVNQMRGALDRLDGSQLSYNHHEETLTGHQEQQAEAQALYERAINLDTGIKRARQAQDSIALSSYLTEAEKMIEEMDNFFISKARPDEVKRSGTKPNTSIVLTEKELDFIEREYGGSKSAAIHEALKRLMNE